MNVQTSINEKDLIELAQHFYQCKTADERIQNEKKVLSLKSHPQFYDLLFNLISIPDLNEAHMIYFVGQLKDELCRVFLSTNPNLGNLWLTRKSH